MICKRLYEPGQYSGDAAITPIRKINRKPGARKSVDFFRRKKAVQAF